MYYKERHLYGVQTHFIAHLYGCSSASWTTITDIHSLEIFHLNSRSIRHKLDNTYDDADDFHVLCFSETHLDPSIGTDTLELEGFDTPLRKDRSQHRGGVMVYAMVSAILFAQKIGCIRTAPDSVYWSVLNFTLSEADLIQPIF